MNLVYPNVVEHVRRFWVFDTENRELNELRFGPNFFFFKNLDYEMVLLL